MNEEQSRRFAEATDALIQAGIALDDARDTLADPRFERELERERMAAVQQLAQRVDVCGRRIDDALRKATVAAGAASTAGAWAKYRAAVAILREGRASARPALEADGIASKRAGVEAVLGRFSEALGLAAVLVFGE